MTRTFHSCPTETLGLLNTSECPSLPSLQPLATCWPLSCFLNFFYTKFLSKESHTPPFLLSSWLLLQRSYSWLWWVGVGVGVEHIGLHLGCWGIQHSPEDYIQGCGSKFMALCMQDCSTPPVCSNWPVWFGRNTASFSHIIAWVRMSFQNDIWESWK